MRRFIDDLRPAMDLNEIAIALNYAESFGTDGGAADDYELIADQTWTRVGFTLEDLAYPVILVGDFPFIVGFNAGVGELNLGTNTPLYTHQFDPIPLTSGTSGLYLFNSLNSWQIPPGSNSVIDLIHGTLFNIAVTGNMTNSNFAGAPPSVGAFTLSLSGLFDTSRTDWKWTMSWSFINNGSVGLSPQCNPFYSAPGNEKAWEGYQFDDSVNLSINRLSMTDLSATIGPYCQVSAT